MAKEECKDRSMAAKGNGLVADDEDIIEVVSVGTDSQYSSWDPDQSGAEDEDRTDDEDNSEMMQVTDDPEPQLLLPTTIEEEENSTTSTSTITLKPSTSFWRYKSFPKGPRGLKYDLQVKQTTDAHTPLRFRDPVIEEISGPKVSLRLNGKPRIGEGNDITPNPNKLAQLGKKIQKVHEQISGTSDETDLKKKGDKTVKAMKKKLISRQCRLKRSANHEANKIIFDGLDREREELSRIIRLLSAERNLPQVQRGRETLTQYAETLKKRYMTTTVAGKFEEYVNHSLKRHRTEDEDDSAIENG